MCIIVLAEPKTKKGNSDNSQNSGVDIIQIKFIETI